MDPNLSAPQPERRKRGRPRKTPAALLRPTITFRARPLVHDHLKETALSNGRSLSEEVESRIDRSILQEREAQAFTWLLEAVPPGSEPPNTLPLHVGGYPSETGAARQDALAAALPEERVRLYITRFGDPLKRAVAIAAMPILAAGVLEGVAERLDCPRAQAAEWWLRILTVTLPFCHPLASAEAPAQAPEPGK
jgi:hypothetical protein